MQTNKAASSPEISRIPESEMSKYQTINLIQVN